MSGLAVNLAAKYAETLNPFNNKPNPNNSRYAQSRGDANMSKIIARHGPIQYFAHIMQVAFNPKYGRDNSIAHKPQLAI
ncbi:hypothetical protein HYX01_00795 [Candidatus Woesearchaeota archaeon]|nr:hypothetical protein [Candidatus Woesearchaeota archaeon]